MRLWYSLLAVLALASSAPAADLDALLNNPNLWTLSQADFEKLPETRGFGWTSVAHDSARATKEKLFGLPVVEVVTRFDSGKLAALTALFYARGDEGGIPEPQFKEAVTKASTAVTTNTKVQFTVRGKDATNAVKAEGLIWQTPTAKYLLEYSFTKEMKTRNIPFRAEFVRLEVKPPERRGSLLANVSLTGRLNFSGAAHVKKDAASGDVLIPDVPMVDQGQKGYCAVACAERMMRYYGVETDANEIAQIANSDASRGTSADAMFDALKKLGQRLKVRVRPIEQFEVKQILSLINDYNREAKRQKAPPLPDQGHMLNVEAIYRSMDKGILKEVRTKNKSDLTRFQSDIQKHIDQGVPLLWSVMLGIVKEPEIPQSYGGHMRLIIGYNTKKNEIMYTDTWGVGHELKRMAADDAWTMTTGLTAIEPSNQ